MAVEDHSDELGEDLTLRDTVRVMNHALSHTIDHPVISIVVMDCGTPHCPNVGCSSEVLAHGVSSEDLSTILINLAAGLAASRLNGTGS